MYLAATDDSGEKWGGTPCTACAIEVIHAGIRRIVSPPLRGGFTKWREDLDFARELLVEAGVELVEVAI
jgi:deoxycytidylate deaminase